MKKKTINAFTLVEMLIVIVIIGILIAALLPRMQAAQWRARDVSRKTALSQIQSAIVVRQWDNWKWPAQDGSWADWIDVKDIATDLVTAWMNGVPEDPLSNEVTWLWNWTGSEWQYRYIITKRNGSRNWWFVLMAQTEVEWWSNRVYCPNATEAKDTETNGLKITSDTDITTNIKLCETFNKTWTANTCSRSGTECTYSETSMLRYIITY